MDTDKYRKIPLSFEVGGVNIAVEFAQHSPSDGVVGQTSIAEDKISIFDEVGINTHQGKGSQVNSFYHELVHAILITMGEDSLNKNERFVCTFAGFLTEAMKNAYFKED